MIDPFKSSSELTSDEGAVAGRQAETTVVWLRGDHDFSTTSSLIQTIKEAVALDETFLTIDLSNVQFMDAATIGIMIRTRNYFLRLRRSLTLRAPSSQARRVLDVCGLTDFLVDQSSPAVTVDPNRDQE